MKATKRYIEELATEMKLQLSKLTIRNDGKNNAVLGLKSDGDKDITVQDFIQIYKDNNLTERRAIWDLFSRCNGNHNKFKFSRTMYDVLNGHDEHIETAIKASIKLL